MSDPLLTVSAAGLRAAGVTLSAAEAVACVLLTGKALEWSADAPDPSRVILRGDGRISVSPPAGAAGAKGFSDGDPDDPGAARRPVRVETYARLLHRLLPDGAVHGAQTPGALRLTVARGVGALDAPPFASVDDFRTAIERFVVDAPEDHVVSAVLRWAEVIGSQTDDRLPERRVSGPRVDVLRRMLREADLERYAMVASAPAREVRPAAPVLSFPREPERERPAGPYAPVFATIEAPVEAHGRWRAYAAVAVLAATVGYAGAVVVREYGVIVGAGEIESARSTTDDLNAQASAAAAHVDDETGPPVEAIEDVESSAGAAPPAVAAAGGSSRAPVAEATSGDARMRAAAQAPHDVAAKASAVEGDRVMSSLSGGTGGLARGTDQRTVIDAGMVTYSGFRLANVIDGEHHTGNVRLSPDGSRVAFDSDREGERGVYVAARDGTGVTRVSGKLPARAPAWSPDGRRLAFLRSEQDNPLVRNLWMLDLETGEERRLTAWRYGEMSPADWFADGRRLCYGHDGRLYVMDLATGASRSYDPPVAGNGIGAVAASPEGGRVAFHVKGDGVWMLDLGKGQTRRVLDDGTVEQLAWSPTGTSLAYHSRQSGAWAVHVVGR